MSEVTPWAPAEFSTAGLPEHRRLALDAMSRAGALVVPMETVVYQMLKRSGTAPFKALLAYFR